MAVTAGMVQFADIPHAVLVSTAEREADSGHVRKPLQAAHANYQFGRSPDLVVVGVR